MSVTRSVSSPAAPESRRVPLPGVPTTGAGVAGAEIAGYRLLERVGAGGMGQVYRAVQARLDRIVALKIIRPEIAAQWSFCERFRREARLAAAIDHPNVVPVYEAGEAEGVLFVA